MLPKFLDFSLWQAFWTALTFLVLLAVAKFIIQPFRTLDIYSKLPGSKVTYKIGNKTVRTKSNVKEVIREPSKKYPYISSTYYDQYLNYPDLRFTAENILHIPLVILTDHELVGEFYKNHKYYQKYQIKTLFKRYLRHSLGGSDGETWKNFKKIISQAFQFENLQRVIPIIEDTIVEQFGNFKPHQTDVNLLQHLQILSGEATARSFFGESLKDTTINGRSIILELADLYTRNSKLYHETLYQIFGDISMMWSSEFRKLKRETIAFGEFSRGLVRRMIERIKKGETDNSDGRKGILQLLMESDHGEGIMGEREYLGNFINFFFAGTDTTSHFLQTLFYFVSQEPEVRKKLMEQIDANWDGKSRLTFDKIQKMEYLQAVVDETFRMANPGQSSWPRITLADHYLKDVLIKKGTWVAGLFMKSNFNPRLYTDVNSFKPERWLRDSGSFERPQDPFAYTPFSAGPRVCMGQNFAVLEAKIITCYFMKNFDFELTSDPNFEMVFKHLVEPKTPLLFEIRRKKI